MKAINLAIHVNLIIVINKGMTLKQNITKSTLTNCDNKAEITKLDDFWGFRGLKKCP